MKIQGDPKDEYSEVSENLRHFGNIRFAQMTLMFVLTGALLTALFQTNTLSLVGENIIKIGGLFVAVLFFLMDQRAMVYWHHYLKRAIELEKCLGFKQYSTVPVSSYLSATNAIRILYAGVFTLWIIMIVGRVNF